MENRQNWMMAKAEIELQRLINERLHKNGILMDEVYEKAKEGILQKGSYQSAYQEDTSAAEG